MPYPNEYKAYGPSAIYDQEATQCEAAQEPFTNQLSNRLSESEKRIADLIAIVGQVTDRLFGPAPTLAKLPPDADMKNVPVQRSMMDQLLLQTNMVNRRLGDLSDVVRRLNTL
jgi:hypothetical protein